MNDGTTLTPEQANALFARNEAMKRLRTYDRVQARPGRQLVNVAKVGRNDPCPCGSKGLDGRPVKFKNCCMGKE